MEKIKNQKEISTYHNNLNNIFKSYKPDAKFGFENGWIKEGTEIKEVVN